MRISNDDYPLIKSEREVYNRVLPMDGKNILELGCGKADFTFAIAKDGRGRNIIAMEVDRLQLDKNLELPERDNVSFRYGGAENIPLDDNSQDIVLMFKSLHHVPENKMYAAMNEIQRVLKTNGLLYVSEPVFSGDINEVLRLFHDEEIVRQSAFNAIRQSIEDDRFILEEEIFFCIHIEFGDFSDFADKAINVSHTNHQLPDDVLEEVKKRFENLSTLNNGLFSVPHRVDLLRNNK
ncbi:MAG: methyltransferase domain-containing protein [Gammaproteobacteria bacterium]|nr:methyltransferase domain-containing protein [Gammaproteobacteria bacterium]